MTATFQINDVIQYGDTRAEVLRVAKNGRLFVSFWGHGLKNGELVKMWIYADNCVVIRRWMGISYQKVGE